MSESNQYVYAHKHEHYVAMKWERKFVPSLTISECGCDNRFSAIRIKALSISFTQMNGETFFQLSLVFIKSSIPFYRFSPLIWLNFYFITEKQKREGKRRTPLLLLSSHFCLSIRWKLPFVSIGLAICTPGWLRGGREEEGIDCPQNMFKHAISGNFPSLLLTDKHGNCYA